jgi:hypothetical protein
MLGATYFGFTWPSTGNTLFRNPQGTQIYTRYTQPRGKNTNVHKIHTTKGKEHKSTQDIHNQVEGTEIYTRYTQPTGRNTNLHKIHTTKGKEHKSTQDTHNQGERHAQWGT